MTFPSKRDNPKGLHKRFFVEKIDGPTDPNAEYFVLRLDPGGRDAAHIMASRAALLTYAERIEGHLPELAADIRERYAYPEP